jgi:glutamate-1-semialdehyde 2,1-aminomutase
VTVAVRRETLQQRFEAAFAGSRARFEKARRIFPDGVTHDSRRLEPFPIYVSRALGSKKWDVDGHELIDFWNGHGALLLGHSPPAVVAAVQEQIAKGTHYGACHELEIAWGEWVQRLVPCAERVRFTSSGTEATLMALRLARIFTGRPKVLKFVGHFHGWHDAVMPGAYPPYEVTAVPGLPGETAMQTVVIPPNDLDVVEKTLTSDPQIGAVILEPTGGHWGLVPIRGEFLRGLRQLTEKHGQVLIFDEVITGFRVSPGGAQAHYGIKPDLTTLAKILAGGLPGGAVAGRAEVMASIEVRPGRPKMRHPGTYNANPLSAAAGVAALAKIASGEPCQRANETARVLKRKLNTLFAERFPDWIAYGDFSLLHIKPGYDGSRPTDDDFIPYDGRLERLDGPKDMKLQNAWRHGLLLNGVDWFGLGAFVTAAHSEADVDATVAAVAQTIEWLRTEGIR